MHFSGTVVFSDTDMHMKSAFKKFKRSMLFCDLYQRSLVRHLSTFSNDLLLCQFQFNYICSILATGEENLSIWLRSHDQDGCYAHIWKKP